MSSQNFTSEQQQTSVFETWFDEFVATLRSHQIQLETDTATDDLKSFYKSLFSGNLDEIAKQNKLMTQQHFVKNMVFDYIKSIGKFMPLRLAFDYNDSEVLVWAEIQDDDDVAEKNLILGDAEVSAKYHQYGFGMNTTIVEKGDEISVPNHYQIYK
ncbi:MAG: hypothetical protein KDC92_05985 [Bacteroidetes bacterium]|nr:hypothetical protein [Bacteroidota bacterium]